MVTTLESLLAVEDLRRLSLSLAGVADLLVEGAIASFCRWVSAFCVQRRRIARRMNGLVMTTARAAVLEWRQSTTKSVCLAKGLVRGGKSQLGSRWPFFFRAEFCVVG